MAGETRDVTVDGNLTNVTTVTDAMRLLIIDTGTLKDVTASVLKTYSKFIYSKTTAPTASNDSTQGYAVGDIWLDETNDVIYQAIDVSTGAAIWKKISNEASGVVTGMLNGKIVTSVTSNNLTVAIKTLAGADPSASDPVYVQIGNTVRSITSALSITVNAGTNWFNSGSTELATKEVDYFVYLGYNTTNGVVLGFSRIPYARTYGDFNTTSTDELYAAISNITNATSADEYEVVGRFNAILSAGAGYTWSLPSPSIVISRPIFETRWLSWQPTYSGAVSMTFTSVTTTQAVYKINSDMVTVSIDVNGTTGGTASYAVQISAPIKLNSAKMAGIPYFPCYIIDSTKPGGYLRYAKAVYDGIQAERLAEDAWGLGSGRIVRGTLIYAI